MNYRFFNHHAIVLGWERNFLEKISSDFNIKAGSFHVRVPMWIKKRKREKKIYLLKKIRTLTLNLGK